MIRPFQAKYYAHELTRRQPSNSLEKLTNSLLDAQVDLNPHQVEAALFAFRSPLSKGAILADEVGLGKTIEAGLVISQKWAERHRKILIIVPSNLRKQWNLELKEKFFLDSIILETASFNKIIKSGNLNPFDHNVIIICSFHFARNKDIYIQQVNWDLVIIDEAHRLRNVYKSSSKIANAIKETVAPFKKILLTATPLQNSLLELYGLVSIIDNYSFGDLKSFKDQFIRITNNNDFNELRSRLQPICIRTLRKQVLEYIRYTNRHAIVQEFVPSEKEQKLYDLVSDYLQSPKLYALPASQRQLMTLILRKLLSSSTYAISGTLEALANKLEVLHANQTVVENELETEFASNYEVFEEIKDEWIDDEEEEGNEGKKEKGKIIYTKEQLDEIEVEKKSLLEFSNLAKSIKINSKGTVLLTALKGGISETLARGGKEKALIFTESVRTQNYLYQILQKTEYKNKVVLFNGSNNDEKSKEIYANWIKKHKGTDKISDSKTADKRAAIVEFFRDKATIMIATESAAEGINLQFCSLVVNYDLPWNPQRIEQRIGRCHRYGQQSDVVVVNFLNKSNAADQRVYKLLDEKFKLFNGVFGASDEVLGSIESGVDFEKRIALIYQNCRTPEEIQQSFDELQQQLEGQIDEKMKSTRQMLLENFDEEVHEKLRLNLQKSKEYLNKYENWLWEITKFQLNINARFSESDHSFYLVKNPFKNEIINPGPYRIGKNIEKENVYRTGHPLAQRVINSCKQKIIPLLDVEFNLSNSGKIISILEGFKNKSGWLMAELFTIDSFEAEDYVVLSAYSEDGITLDQEQCQRVLNLPASENKEIKDLLLSVKKQLSELSKSHQNLIIEQNAERNAVFFDDELTKLDKWAEDVKTSLELNLKHLDMEIKTLKTEAKKILKLEEKIKAQRQIKELEKKRNEMRMQLYAHQDDVDKKKEALISEIEERMKQKTHFKELFTIHWTII
jgi:superfamily II DNA/RNA helicase